MSWDCYGCCYDWYHGIAMIATMIDVMGLLWLMPWNGYGCCYGCCYSSHYSSHHFAPPWSWPLLSLRSAMVIVIAMTIVVAMTMIIVIVIIITSLGHNHRNFLSYSSLIWEIIYTIRYPCIYQKFPRSFHDTSNFPYHTYISNLMWSLSISYRERV